MGTGTSNGAARWTRPFASLITTGRLWWRHWPQLVLLVLLRHLVGWVLIHHAAVEVGLQNRLLGLCVLSLPVLADLLFIVAMFHVLKPSLPGLGGLAVKSPTEASREAGREAFVRGLALALVPFFAYYAAWGFLGDSVRKYSLAALPRLDPFTPHAPLLEVLDAPGLVTVVAATWLLRRGAKALDARRHRPLWKLVIILCEATWLFIGLFVFNAWKGQAVAWWQSRVAHEWWAGLAQAWSARLPAQPTALVGRALGALRDIGLYALLPMVWLAISALIYGREMGRADANTADPRLARVAAGYQRLPSWLHRSGEHLAKGYRTRFVPVFHSLRLVLAAGLPLLVILAVGYRALDWLSLWAWIGVTHVIGPHSIEAWQVIGPVLGLLLVDPIRIEPSVIVEPLRICLLAAVLEGALAARACPAAPQAGAADPPASASPQP